MSYEFFLVLSENDLVLLPEVLRAVANCTYCPKHALVRQKFRFFRLIENASIMKKKKKKSKLRIKQGRR